MHCALSVQKRHIKYTVVPNEAHRPQHFVVNFGYVIYVNLKKKYSDRRIQRPKHVAELLNFLNK